MGDGEDSSRPPVSGRLARWGPPTVVGVFRQTSPAGRVFKRSGNITRIRGFYLTSQTKEVLNLTSGVSPPSIVHRLLLSYRFLHTPIKLPRTRSVPSFPRHTHSISCRSFLWSSTTPSFFSPLSCWWGKRPKTPLDRSSIEDYHVKTLRVEGVSSVGVGVRGMNSFGLSPRKEPMIFFD